MTTKAQKPIPIPGTQAPKASKINKQKIIDAIVNLENQVQKITNDLAGLDDAFRQYILFNKSDKTFQTFLNLTNEKRKAEFDKQQKKLKKEVEKQGLINANGKPIKSKSK